jgi:hypothetical protein
MSSRSTRTPEPERAERAGARRRQELRRSAAATPYNSSREVRRNSRRGAVKIALRQEFTR